MPFGAATSTSMVDLALLAKSWRDFRALRIRLLGGKKPSIHRKLPGAWPAIRSRCSGVLMLSKTSGQWEKSALAMRCRAYQRSILRSPASRKAVRLGSRLTGSRA